LERGLGENLSSERFPPAVRQRRGDDEDEDDDEDE